MRSTRMNALLITVLGACGVSTAALANSPWNIYLGAGAGESHIKTGAEVYDPTGTYDGADYRFDAHHSAWKLIAGVRPISPLGVEVEYIDFGNPSTGVRLLGATWSF